MNRKMNLKIVSASIATGLLLAFALPTTYAQGQMMGTVSGHSGKRMMQPGAHMSHHQTQSATGSDVVGFGEYDPAQPSAANETGSMHGHMMRAMTGTHIGFADDDPSSNAMMDGAQMQSHRMMRTTAAGNAGHTTQSQQIPETCMEVEAPTDHASC